jgi:hypothetical protein
LPQSPPPERRAANVSRQVAVLPLRGGHLCRRGVDRMVNTPPSHNIVARFRPDARPPRQGRTQQNETRDLPLLELGGWRPVPLRQKFSVLASLLQQ